MQLDLDKITTDYIDAHPVYGINAAFASLLSDYRPGGRYYSDAHAKKLAISDACGGIGRFERAYNDQPSIHGITINADQDMDAEQLGKLLALEILFQGQIMKCTSMSVQAETGYEMGCDHEQAFAGIELNFNVVKA